MDPKVIEKGANESGLFAYIHELATVDEFGCDASLVSTVAGLFNQGKVEIYVESDTTILRA